MDFKIIHIEETDSTNRWLKEHGEPLLCVVADYQTAGKGCGTNTWESERGKNLTFSVMIHPEEIPASGQFLISEAVSVALCRTLSPYIYNKVEIKWPNDIYVDDRKICGILIENRLQGPIIKDAVIGIGLNVNQTTFVSDAPNPVSLCQITGYEMNREALLDEFLKRLDEALHDETVPTDYRSRLYRRDGLFAYRDQEGLFRARLKDVLPDGRLLLTDEAGQERTYAFKEVQFVI